MNKEKILDLQQERKERALRNLPLLKLQEQAILKNLDRVRQLITQAEQDAEVNVLYFDKLGVKKQ